MCDACKTVNYDGEYKIGAMENNLMTTKSLAVLEWRAGGALGKELNFVQGQDIRSARQYVKGGREGDGRTIDILTNHGELHIESKRVRAFCIRS
jgi:hypothetical protein